jgi:hypothetical protein
MRTVFATDFGIWPIFKDHSSLSDRIIETTDYWARLANYILLYDQIVIPTGNFQILSVLRLMLGEGVFDEFVRRKIIVFARFDHWFAYHKGEGVTPFQIHEGANVAPNPLGSFFKPPEFAIDTALALTYPPTSSNRKAELKKLLLDNVIILPAKEILQDIKESTYHDIFGNAYFRKVLGIKGRTSSFAKLDNLPKSDLNKCTIFNPHAVGLDHTPLKIKTLLRVAFENSILGFGAYAKTTEITGDESAFCVLPEKAHRLGYSRDGEKTFVQMQKMSDVPDIGQAFAKKRLQPQQLLEFRDSKACQNLRDWFAKGKPTDQAEDTLRRYKDSIEKEYWCENIMMKTVRLAVLTVAGAVLPGTAIIALSIADMYLPSLIKKWFPNKSPSIFLESAKTILESSAISPPTSKGRDRNRLCSCGSNKKFKFCCRGK